MKIEYKYDNDYSIEVLQTEVDRICLEVTQLSNLDLFNQYTDLAGGDDYDSCYTPYGLIVYRELEAELDERLINIGFFPSD